MVWAFIFLFVALKIPLGMLLYIVWWAVHEVPEEAEEERRDDDDGGGGGGRPRPRRPRPPRRGPHRGAAPHAPPRVRVRSRPTRLPARSHR
jgi:hypothetical protein